MIARAHLLLQRVALVALILQGAHFATVDARDSKRADDHPLGTPSGVDAHLDGHANPFLPQVFVPPEEDLPTAAPQAHVRGQFQRPLRRPNGQLDQEERAGGVAARRPSTTGPDDGDVGHNDNTRAAARQGQAQNAQIVVPPGRRARMVQAVGTRGGRMRHQYTRADRYAQSPVPDPMVRTLRRAGYHYSEIDEIMRDLPARRAARRRMRSPSPEQPAIRRMDETLLHDLRNLARRP
ncbi:hypothetical protein IE81DRAFT_350302 [Ceraceosorus guamensis]|uniref:Secreted protein n=1 Tax=Ceraceosorus guamensis TaxID=1522189 RepID=A0A316VP35_9BASI|nr:hypothetical protein IE81DRAFT_350302 [Ceraceosorus guamensis]PWN39292.1 hypothetical protein IE81DRAFT_350302 [Ceraceosorus guamensis]